MCGGRVAGDRRLRLSRCLTMPTPRKPKAGMEADWNDKQRSLVAWVWILGCVVGMTLIGTMARVEDHFYLNLAIGLEFLGMGLTAKNLSAMYGLTPKRASLGGGVICFLATLRFTSAFFPDNFWLSMTITQIVALSFIGHA